MKKLNYTFRTLDDPMVQLSLEGLNALEGNPISKGLYMLVGGFATQSYLTEEERRPTADIDVLAGLPLNYAAFKQFSKPIMEFLKDNGCEVRTKKAHQTLCLEISKDDERVMLEFPNRNKEHFSKNEKRIHRELENARMKGIIHKEGIAYRTSSPEDIVVPKLVRIIHAHQRGIDFKKADQKTLMKTISELREEAIYKIGDEGYASKLRTTSDAYDILALYSQVGLNKNYFQESSSDWDVFKEDIEGKQEILDFLLPAFHN